MAEAGNGSSGDSTPGSGPGPKPSLSERLSKAFLKPADPAKAAAKPAGPPKSLEEIRQEAKAADDKERLIGLIAAPFAGAIAIMVIADLVAHDPAAPSKLHVSVSLYHELEVVLLALAALMLITAWFRKRLYLAIVMALYGLAIFNLHYWGFGVPFILAGAWFMVRTYRVQQELKKATEDAGGGAPRNGAGGTGTPGSGSAPRASKRYTPPTPQRNPQKKRPAAPRPEPEEKAG